MSSFVYVSALLIAAKAFDRMSRNVIFILFPFLFKILTFVTCEKLVTKTEPALLVLSFDAFRPDYLNRNVTPNLNQFRQDGVSAEYMLNVFPTKTFVNHFSIATVSRFYSFNCNFN